MSNIETTRVMGAGGPSQDRTQVVPGGSQATMVMPGQADALRTQMGGTTTCPICKSTTPLMDPFCGDCGFLLSSPPVENAEVPAEETPAGELIDPQTGRRFRLRAGVNTLGRQGTDILVDEGTVSRNHARITVENGSATIEDLGSSNGTKVGDQRLTANEPVQAATGTRLRFGNWNVTLEIAGSPGAGVSPAATIVMPAGGEADKTLVAGAFASEETFAGSTPAALAAPSPSADSVEPVSGGALVGWLRKIDGPGEDIAVTEGVISIGRRPENTVVLTGDAYVSGRHAEIVTDSTGTYLTDVGSTNGTVVNGAKIAANDRLLLSPGDEVHIGQSKFQFSPTSSEESVQLGETDSAPSADASGAESAETQSE
jgi:pSer/pThr/pTyr-binding forkhead associated (FHA) protein